MKVRLEERVVVPEDLSLSVVAQVRFFPHVLVEVDLLVSEQGSVYRDRSAFVRAAVSEKLRREKEKDGDE